MSVKGRDRAGGLGRDKAEHGRIGQGLRMEDGVINGEAEKWGIGGDGGFR